MNYLPFRVIILTALAALLINASAQADLDWSKRQPDDVGLDGERLEGLVGRIRDGRDYPRINSLLIARHGTLVLEEYFRGTRTDTRGSVQSVSKSFTSAIVGIAIEDGLIEGVGERILNFFPDYDDIENLDERKRAMTLQDLLTMRAGTDYHERGSDSPHWQLNRLPRGWDRFYLNRPMIAAPGTRFQYDSGGVILMSALIKARFGAHADVFARPRLFEPLGIEGEEWFRNREGHPHMGGGLRIRARDMLIFGQLYLQQGEWQGRQIISRRWVEESFKQHVNLTRSHLHVTGYGYLWWIMEPSPAGAGKEPVYAAFGANGQFIFIVPEHGMVVAVTGSTRRYSDEIKPMRFLYTDILPAVQK